MPPDAQAPVLEPAPLSPGEPIPLPRLALLDLGSAGNSAARSLATALLGSLMANLFDSSARTIGYTLSLAGLAGVLVPPLVGRLSDRTRTRWGRRVPYIAGFSLAFAVALALLPFASRFGVFVALVGVVFAGVVGAQTAYQTLLVDVLPKGGLERGFATASAMSGAGGAVGLLAGGWLLGLGPALPFLGVAGFALGVVALSLGSFREPPATAADTAAPLGWRRMLAHRPFALLLLGQVLWWLALGSLTPFFVLYAERVLRLSAGVASSVLVVIGLVGLGVSAALAKIGLDNARRRLVLVGGLLAMTLGFGVAFVGGPSLPLALLGVALAAAGAGVLSVVPSAIVGAIAPEGGHGAYQGLSTVSKALGQTVAPPLAGYAISNLGNGDYRFMLLVAAAGTLLSVVPALAMGVPRPPPEPA